MTLASSRWSGVVDWVTVKLSELQRLLNDEFGRGYAHTVVSTHVISDDVRPGVSRTVEEWLGLGRDPGWLWERLCADFSIPEERWLGVDRPVTRSGSDPEGHE